MFQLNKYLKLSTLCGLFFLTVLLFACQNNSKPAWGSDAKAETGAAISDVQPQTQSTRNTQRKAPDYVYDVWDYVVKNGRSKRGYVGGRTFQNREKRLPRNVKYREWDVHKKVKGKKSWGRTIGDWIGGKCLLYEGSLSDIYAAGSVELPRRLKG